MNHLKYLEKILVKPAYIKFFTKTPAKGAELIYALGGRGVEQGVRSKGAGGRSEANVFRNFTGASKNLFFISDLSCFPRTAGSHKVLRLW
jgi:hypothetical protein